MKLAILITCHNRREITLTCLKALFESHLPEDVLLEVFLVDDGSSDGTGEAVRQMFPDVHVLEGNGNLYWNGGMRKAFAAAMEQSFDQYLWLNDDTFLYPHTIATMLLVADQVLCNDGKSVIVVGSTQTEMGGKVNHGGVVKWKRLNSELVVPQDTPIPCETMYGNCVLIPRKIAQVVGNLDAAFVHSIGDVDYGLRARKAGFQIVVMPGFAGICSLNPVAGSISDTSLPLRLRYQKLLSPTGLPVKPFSLFLWRHFGIKGLIYGVWVYLKIVITWLYARLKVI
ncbi:MAG: glycosyltransferase family 2 protein [Methylobacter sp.]